MGQDEANQTIDPYGADDADTDFNEGLKTDAFGNVIDEDAEVAADEPGDMSEEDPDAEDESDDADEE